MQDKLRIFLPLILIFCFSVLNVRAVDLEETVVDLNQTNLTVTVENISTTTLATSTVIQEVVESTTLVLNTTIVNLNETSSNNETKANCSCKTKLLLTKLEGVFRNGTYKQFNCTINAFVKHMRNVSEMAEDKKVRYMADLVVRLLDMLNTSVSRQQQTASSVQTQEQPGLLRLFKFEYYRNLNRDREENEREQDHDDNEDNDDDDNDKEHEQDDGDRRFRFGYLNPFLSSRVFLSKYLE